jgi:hypothetical protein
VKRSQTQVARNSKARSSTRPNNMYADKNGNVLQRNKDGSWQQKSNRKSNPKTQPSTRPAQKQGTGSSSVSRNQSQLNKSYQNRSRGSQNASRSRSFQGSSRGRTGGVRRR